MSNELTVISENAPLTENERVELLQRELIIERGVKTFFEVGMALFEIRNMRLYRASHATFQDYCERRWNMTHRRANQLIGASAVIENIKLGTVVPNSNNEVSLLPANEAQARPLTRLEPEQQIEAWNEALAASPHSAPTAEKVDEIVQKRLQTNKAKAHIHRSGQPKSKVPWVVMMMYNPSTGVITGCRIGRRGLEKLRFTLDDLRKAGVPIEPTP